MTGSLDEVLIQVMCRLYAFRATEPTRVECTLVHAQNALLSQSRADLSGTSHASGWGVATFESAEPHVERQAWAAYHEEHFARAAARVYAATVLAHIRRATVGPPALENTHPFVDGRWVLAHNGTVPGFDRVRPALVAGMSPGQRASMRGVTDSEHVFRYLRSKMEASPDTPVLELLGGVVRDVERLCAEAGVNGTLGLNLMLSDGRWVYGSRLGRSLHYLCRDGIRDCEICGFPHVHHDPSTRYRAVVVASEPITHEPWCEMQERSLYEIGPDARIRIASL